MPFSEAETIFFEDVLDGFEPNNITAKNCTLYTPDMQTFERSGLTVRRPMPYNAEIITGLDITAGDDSVTQLSVPSSLTTNDILNHKFKLSAPELNDPKRRADKAKAAVISLSAKVDNSVATEVGNRGSLVVTKAGQIDAYLDGALAEATMQEQDINIGMERCLIFNPRDAANVAANIANRQTMNNPVMSAYQRSQLQPIGGFETLRASFNPRLGAAAGGAITVAGAQNYVPLATNAAGENVDNRFMDLTVSATANVAVGDAFTIAGVNSVGHIHKDDTGQLKTFRVVEVVNGTTIKITPAIIPVGGASRAEREYANVTAGAAAGAAITWLNVNAAQVNTFFCKNAVEIIHGRLPGDEFAGMDVMRETTDSGVEILFAKQSAINDISTTYRLTMWARGHMLNTEMGGILIGGQ